MAARRSEKIFFNSNDSPSESPEIVESKAPAKRVLSVSPKLEIRESETDRSSLRNVVNDHKVLMSPRVVDQQVFDELAGSLRSLIDEGAETSIRLQKLIEQSQDSDRWVGKASEHLQERLKLSARMLKAFQAQITRVEQSIEQLDQQEQVVENAQGSMNESLDEFEHHLSERLEKFEKHMNEMADRTINRYEKKLKDRGLDLARIETQINEAQKRAGVALSVAEEVEASVTRLAHHTAENAASIETRSGEAKVIVNRELARITEQSDQVMARLDSGESTLKELHIALEDISQRARNDVSASEKHIEEAAVRCRGIRCALETKLDQCHEAEKEFEKQFVVVTELVSSLNVDAKSYDSLRDLLARLEPWRNLLLRENGEQAGLPEAVASMIDELKADLGHDMKCLSGIMSDVATRIDRSGLGRTRVGEMTELKPDALKLPSELGATIETIEIESKEAKKRRSSSD